MLCSPPEHGKRRSAELMRTVRSAVLGSLPRNRGRSASEPADWQQVLAGHGFAPSDLERRALGMRYVLLKYLGRPAGHEARINRSMYGWSALGFRDPVVVKLT